MKKEHITMATGFTILSLIVGSIVFYFNKDSARAETDAFLDKKLTSLCNDYGQTVNRVDQNLQSIGKALKVPIVTGSANIDPCK